MEKRKRNIKRKEVWALLFQGILYLAFSIVIGNSLIFCTSIQITFLIHLYMLILLGNQDNEHHLRGALEISVNEKKKKKDFL